MSVTRFFLLSLQIPLLDLKMQLHCNFSVDAGSHCGSISNTVSKTNRKTALMYKIKLHVTTEIPILFIQFWVSYCCSNAFTYFHYICTVSYFIIFVLPKIKIAIDIPFLMVCLALSATDAEKNSGSIVAKVCGLTVCTTAKKNGSDLCNSLKSKKFFGMKIQFMRFEIQLCPCACGQ